MGLLDDLKKQGDAALKQLGSNVQTYIKSNVTEAFVKVGQPPKGNLTAEQIAQGQTGQAAQAAITPPNGLQMVTANMGYILPVVAVVAVLLLMKRK